MFGPTLFDDPFPSAAPRPVLLDAFRFFPLRSQNIDLPQAKVFRRVQPERGRVPPEDTVFAGLRNVQSGFDGRLILRDGIERPVEHGASSLKRNVRGVLRMPP